jgi:predicted transcriptional regulator
MAQISERYLQATLDFMSNTPKPVYIEQVQDAINASRTTARDSLAQLIDNGLVFVRDETREEQLRRHQGGMPKKVFWREEGFTASPTPLPNNRRSTAVSRARQQYAQDAIAALHEDVRVIRRLLEDLTRQSSTAMPAVQDEQRKQREAIVDLLTRTGMKLTVPNIMMNLGWTSMTTTYALVRALESDGVITSSKVGNTQFYHAA